MCRSFHCSHLAAIVAGRRAAGMGKLKMLSKQPDLVSDLLKQWGAEPELVDATCPSHGYSGCVKLLAGCFK